MLIRTRDAVHRHYHVVREEPALGNDNADHLLLRPPPGGRPPAAAACVANGQQRKYATPSCRGCTHATFNLRRLRASGSYASSTYTYGTSCHVIVATPLSC